MKELKEKLILNEEDDEQEEGDDGRISKKMLNDMNLDVDAIEQEIEETQPDLVDVPDIEDVNTGMYTIISQEMRDTLQDIENLKSIIVTLKAEDAEREAWAIESLESIIDERTIHVGMLQSILDSFDNDTKDLIDQGVELTLEEPKDEDEKVLDLDIRENYNEVEESTMKDDKKLQESIEELKKKYPDAYVPEIDKETGLPILPDELFGDWEY